MKVKLKLFQRYFQSFNIIFLVFFTIVLSSCIKSPKVIYDVKYKEVKIPVVNKLCKPDRPKFSKTDKVPISINKLIQYIEILESIIEENNKDFNK